MTTGALTRSAFLVRSGVAIAGKAAARSGIPSARGGSIQGASYVGPLRVLDIGFDQLDAIKSQAEKDLGFSLAFEISDPATLINRAITQPESFDVLSGYHYWFDLIWAPGGLQPVDTRRIVRWQAIENLFKYGKVLPGDPRCTYGQGDAAFRSMYVGDSRVYRVSSGKPRGTQAIVTWVDERTGKPYRGLPEPQRVTAVPTNFNLDSIGYNAHLISRPPEKVSWAELFNARWKGRVALSAFTDVGIQDAALAAEATGLIRFRDKGDMSRKEIDRLIKILARLKKTGHFRSFWATYQDAVDLMQSTEVAVESMWSPMVAQLQARRFPVRYAAPPEGYRGWSNGLAISSEVRNPAALQAAYDYVNWWHTGYAGASMMRQGYYNAVQATSRRFVDPAEWDYWIDGKRAARDLAGPFGDVSIHKGQLRDGGSFVKRACKFACWLSEFREHVFEASRWQDLVG